MQTILFQQNFTNLQRLNLLRLFACDGSSADTKIGEIAINSSVDQMVTFIMKLKTDNSVLDLQNEFYQSTKNPIQRKQ